MKMIEITIPDSRENFTKTWLSEMPEGIGTFELIDAARYNLSDRIKHNPELIVQLDNGFKKIEGITTLYYWFEDSFGEATLIGEFEKSPQAIVVRAVAKSKKGVALYASDLYNVVLQDRKTSPGQIGAIRIMSDTQLSDEGYNLWSKMLQQGHKILVYDKLSPGTSFQGISTEEELSAFFRNDDTSFRRYQYVLTESDHYGEVRSQFNTRKMREQVKGML